MNNVDGFSCQGSIIGTITVIYVPHMLSVYHVLVAGDAEQVEMRIILRDRRQ